MILALINLLRSIHSQSSASLKRVTSWFYVKYIPVHSFGHFFFKNYQMFIYFKFSVLSILIWAFYLPHSPTFQIKPLIRNLKVLILFNTTSAMFLIKTNICLHKYNNIYMLKCLTYERFMHQRHQHFVDVNHMLMIGKSWFHKMNSDWGLRNMVSITKTDEIVI